MIEEELQRLICDRFTQEGIRPLNVSIRTFPGERIVIVEIASQLEKGMSLAAEMDGEISDGFVTVRLAKGTGPKSQAPVSTIADVRVTRLIELLDTRSRTSESQPSLRYIEDVTGRLQIAQSQRHQLIFGRRGVGKTALMLEASKKVEELGSKTVWINLQTLRSFGSLKAFLAVADRICDEVEVYFTRRDLDLRSAILARKIKSLINDLITKRKPPLEDATQIALATQQMLKVFFVEAQTDMYLFLDDTHYLGYDEVPRFLDLVHGMSRDIPVWLKISGIKHQMRWFVDDPPLGLQLGHDAVEINLDITLQHPEQANQFLQKVLDAYVEECDGTPRRAFLSSSAVDRLVLASGGVPRDFFTLCASSIQVARRRASARTAGVQDVNEAAGTAAKAKIEELEDDAASSTGGSKVVLESLSVLRGFLLETAKMVFFRIEFRDKERNPQGYSIIQRLADLRMLHLINSSISDPHQAGVRYEVYLLDLSEYSGSRLKRNLSVLDFRDGHLMLKKTGSKDRPIVGDTSLRLLSILRRGPVFELSQV